MSKDAEDDAVSVPPGEERVVWRSDGARREPCNLLVVATQDESSDDGGSQSARATLRIGSGAGATAVDFDVREGTVVPVPRAPCALVVRNRNDTGQPEVLVRTVLVAGSRPATATLTLDIGYAMADPNVRVPVLANEVVFDHGLSDHLDYRALLSDSATGETYGTLTPLTVRHLDARSRFVRFLDLPEGAMGTVTFLLGL